MDALRRPVNPHVHDIKLHDHYDRISSRDPTIIESAERAIDAQQQNLFLRCFGSSGEVEKVRVSAISSSEMNLLAV